MIHATVPTNRVKMTWQDMISTLEVYKGIVSTGMAHVLFDSFPSEEEFKEFLNSKESEVVAD
jgi:hypothetical protein